MTMTKEHFLQAYRNALMIRYGWASDQAKLARFMESVEMTLNGANFWDHTGAAVSTAWRSIGGKGKPSLRALRSLALED